MPEHPTHHKPLTKRLNAGLSEPAYAALRDLAAVTGLGNNYVLTVILENADTAIDRPALLRAAEALKRAHRKPGKRP